jgi:hypothetical protein
MSSLVTSASLWTNDDNTKKRQSTMRKTIKLRSEQNIPQDMDETTLESDKYGKMTPSTIDDHQEYNSKRNDRINHLLDKITTANMESSGQPMGDFKPMTPPSLNVKKDMETDTEIKQYIPPMPSYLKATIDRKNISSSGQISMNYGLDGASKNYSNYQHSYDPPAQLATKPYYATMGIGNSSGGTVGNDKLMEKINYMIHLLEESQNEKTSNITEEFILYTFLGIFIIFIVDSFSRSGGKYIR